MYIIPILVSVLFLATAHAGAGKIIGLSEAVEADKIHIILDDNKMTGNVIVTGCESCPMELKLLAQTTLLYKKKKIKRKNVWKASGKSGTIFYDKESKKVKKIIW